MPGIFVSYRRDDSQGFAGRLADDLTDRFGEQRVFRDIEIPVGSDFTDVLHRAVAASDLLLVVIGRQWAVRDGLGQGARLFEPTDWVRTEIEAALAQGKQVVPVLVGGADMPAADAMPPSISRLARVQAAVLDDRRWDSDVEMLGDRLRGLCPSLDDAPGDSDRGEPTPAEVLREVGERFLEQVRSRRRPRVLPPRLPPSFGQRMAAGLARGLKRILGALVALALVYAAIRLFGDAQLLGMLDAFEARLQIGWERLQGYLAQL